MKQTFVKVGTSWLPLGYKTPQGASPTLINNRVVIIAQQQVGFKPTYNRGSPECLELDYDHDADEALNLLNANTEKGYVWQMNDGLVLAQTEANETGPNIIANSGKKTKVQKVA